MFVRVFFPHKRQTYIAQENDSVLLQDTKESASLGG